MSTIRRVVITGVSRGLGRAMVEEFIKAGHAVAACARGQAAVSDLAKDFSAPHRFDVVDVRGDREVQTWASAVLADAGPPDLLINNAGLINTSSVLWKVSPDEFSDVIDVNVKGVYHLIRHFVPAMVQRAHGVIVNISSTWGRTTSAEVAPYCASKWAVEGLTGALALELPANMAAVALNPGVIDTQMLRSCFGEHAAAYPSPQQWARTAVPYILRLGPSDNGQSLTVPT